MVELTYRNPLHLQSRRYKEEGRGKRINNMIWKVPLPAGRPWWQRCSGTHHRSGQTRCCPELSLAWSRQSAMRRKCDRCVWFYPPMALTLPGSSSAGNSNKEGKTWLHFILLHFYSKALSCCSNESACKVPCFAWGHLNQKSDSRWIH